MDNAMRAAVAAIKNSQHTTAFTGAGISVESGIPPFRGPGGLWAKYDPKFLEIDYFMSHAEESWQVIKTLFYDFFGKVKPNSAHTTLARLEEEGLLKAVITQNIDNLHQEAGSRNVIEYHGNYRNLVCPKCGRRFDADDSLLEHLPPLCKVDGHFLKPDFVFFGEPIPEAASTASFREASKARVFLLVGTTGEVMPANMVPRLAKQNGATIIEINTDRSAYTADVTDIFLKGRAGEILPDLVEMI